MKRRGRPPRRGGPLQREGELFRRGAGGQGPAGRQASLRPLEGAPLGRETVYLRRRLDLGLAGAIIAVADNWGSADPSGSEALENDDSTRT